MVVYDVEQERVAKICQYLRRFLHWVQNSAFEGELTEAQLERVKLGLRRIIDPAHDSIYVYCVPHKKYLRKEVIGQQKMPTGQFLE